MAKSSGEGPPPKQNPGALAGATGANCKAGELRGEDSTPALKRKLPSRQVRWRQRNPLAAWAHAALRAALNRGLLTRQLCEACGAAEAEAHYDDYARPLLVRWLCRRHHKALHAARARA